MDEGVTDTIELSELKKKKKKKLKPPKKTQTHTLEFCHNSTQLKEVLATQ